MSESVPELFIESQDRRVGFAPKETLELVALWALPEPPKSLEARLCWYTQGKGTMDAEIVQTERVPTPTAAGEHRFRFTLPDEPYSFSGKLISLIWAVELVAEPGARSARFEFALAPTKTEIKLESVDDRGA